MPLINMALIAGGNASCLFQKQWEGLAAAIDWIAVPQQFAFHPLHDPFAVLLKSIMALRSSSLLVQGLQSRTQPECSSHTRIACMMHTPLNDCIH